jgi:DNA-binding CsgD family transcriptional regulator/PAS domain-containing protein
MSRNANLPAVVDLLYAAALEPQRWSDALHQLGGAVGAVGTVMLPVSQQGPRATLDSPELREATEAYQREWWRYDSRVARFKARRLSHGVVSEAELFTPEELARDPFRQEFLRQFGMGAFAAQVVTPLPKLVVSISVQRALARGPFEQDELELLAALGKHAARAVTVSLRLAEARSCEQTLIGALARMACGALVVDDQHRIVFMNGAAENSMGDGLSSMRGELRAASAEHQPLLERLLNCAHQRNEANGPLALPRPSGKKPLLLQAIPMHPAQSADHIDRFLLSRPTVLVIVVDLEQEQEHSPIEALRLLGLTAAEARIAALVGSGHSRREAAEALGISEWTAREALKRVFSKLDISRQSQLVKIVHRVAVLARPPAFPPNGGGYGA